MHLPFRKINKIWNIWIFGSKAYPKETKIADSDWLSLFMTKREMCKFDSVLFLRPPNYLVFHVREFGDNFYKSDVSSNTVELQWLEHLWDYENMFETWVVRANEC